VRREESNLPVANRRRLRKSDLPRLAEPAVWDWLMSGYLDK